MVRRLGPVLGALVMWLLLGIAAFLAALALIEAYGDVDPFYEEDES